MYCLELCAAAVQPDEENERLFMLLLRALAHLAYSENVEPKRVTTVFLMGLTSLIGFRPHVGRCAKCAMPIAPIVPPGLAQDAPIAYFSPEHGGVLCRSCGAGENCRLTAGALNSLQAIMRRGILTLEEEAEIPDVLFEALRKMTESHLDTPIKSGKML